MNIKEERERSLKRLQKEYDEKFNELIIINELMRDIKKAQELGIHVETRTNIIPGKNDNPEEYYKIAQWVKENLGEDSPWHITRFFPAYKLSHLEPTPEEDMYRAKSEAISAGLKNVYVYDDKGCDCAAENSPISFYLNASSEEIEAVNKCAQSCCGDEGVLLKKYENIVKT